jgi:hypothetical protein
VALRPQPGTDRVDDRELSFRSDLETNARMLLLGEGFAPGGIY